MKIQQPTPDTLITKSGAGAGLFIGLLFMAIGIGGVVFALSGAATSKSILLAAGAIFFVIGALVFFSASSETVVLRKNGQSSVENKRAIGGSKTLQTFDTATIRSVRLVTTMLPTNTGGGLNSSRASNGRQSQLSLELSDNSQIVLGTASGSGGLSVNGIGVTDLIQKAPLSKEAHQISEFLGVPLDAGDFSNPVATIRSLKNAITGEQQQPTTTPPTVPAMSQQPQSASPEAPVQPQPTEYPPQQ